MIKKFDNFVNESLTNEETKHLDTVIRMREYLYNGFVLISSGSEKLKDFKEYIEKNEIKDVEILGFGKDTDTLKSDDEVKECVDKKNFEKKTIFYVLNGSHWYKYLDSDDVRKRFSMTIDLDNIK